MTARRSSVCPHENDSCGVVRMVVQHGGCSIGGCGWAGARRHRGVCTPIVCVCEWCAPRVQSVCDASVRYGCAFTSTCVHAVCVCVCVYVCVRWDGSG